MNTNNELRRLGCIKYAGELLNTNLEAVRLIYQSFIPMHMQYDAAEDVYVVKGVCKAFREVAIGEQIPSYKAIFHNSHGLSIEWQEVIDVCSG